MVTVTTMLFILIVCQQSSAPGRCYCVERGTHLISVHITRRCAIGVVDHLEAQNICAEEEKVDLET